MSRHPLFRRIKNITSEILRDSAKTVSQIESPELLSRRDFLLSTMALTAAVRPLSAVEKLVPRFVRGSQGSRVVIVGAGISGLVASYRLLQAGVDHQIFEANNRLGGRIITQKNFNKEGMFCELGGEVIDSTQHSILGICEELRVPIEDFSETDTGFTKIYFSQGKLRTEEQVQTAAKPLLKIMLKDMSFMKVDGKLQTPTYDKKMGPEIHALDRMSLVEYLQSKKGSVESWLLDLIQESYESEFGVTAAEQSALNLLALFDDDPSQVFKMYGTSDETKRVVGGNSNLILALQKKIDPKVPMYMGHQLVRVMDRGSSFELTFLTAGKTKVVTADRVIMTVPFSVLRSVEGINKLEFSPAKKRSIAELGYGTDSKLILGFKERFWRKQNGSIPPSCGTMFGDFPTQCFWETSRLQKGSHGIMTALFGGHRGLNPPANVLDMALKDLEKIYSDASKKWDGNKIFMIWPKMKYAMGSYSTPKVGQYMTIIGAAGEPELGGRMLFAGEHCSVQKQGYMDGAVESGNTVAKQFLENNSRVISGK